MIDRRMIFLTVVLAGGCQDLDAPDDAAGDEVVAAQEAAPTGVRQPEYDEQGALIQPTDLETWVFLGTGLNLNYTEGGRSTNAPDIFTTTFMEPSAYRHYKQTGQFPQGTMTYLRPYRAGSGAAPAKSGQFLGDSLGIEMSVKDSRRNPTDTWSYWAFPGGAKKGQLRPASQCHACHTEHAQTDLVFTQFYPNLRKPAAATAR